MATHVEHVLAEYQVAIATLVAPAKDNKSPTDQQVFAVLTARDAVQRLLLAAAEAPEGSDACWQAEDLLTLTELDAQLHELTATLGSHPKLERWRTSLRPPETAWWWHLKPPTDPRDRKDWLWNGLTVTAIAANLALVTDIATRFLTGAPGVLSSFAAILPGLLTLFASGGALTKAGQDAIEKALTNLNLSKHRWHEAKFGLSLALLAGLIGFHTTFPNIASFYTQAGKKQYDDGQLAGAQAHFERALSLNPDASEAQFRLAVVHEDLQQFDKAEVEYRKALQGGYLPAYNNLARLYLLQNAPNKAMPLLRQGLRAFDPNQHEPDLQYAFYKNMGWARLQQKRYDEAEAELQQAITLQPERADAYCLLAQVLEQKVDEQQQAKAALPQWENCLKYAHALLNDEWIDLARKRLDAKE